MFFTLFTEENETKKLKFQHNYSGMLLYLHHRKSKLFLHPAKFDNFKDEKISEFKTVSVSQRKNLLG